MIMKTIIIGERGYEPEFEEKLAELSYVTVVGRYEREAEAWKCLQNEVVDLVILYDRIPAGSNLNIGTRIMQWYPGILVLYITTPGADLETMLHQGMATVILKPYTREEIDCRLQMLEVLACHRKRRIYARTFGYFDLFVDGKPVMFKSAKAKELLAILIDRQGGVVDSDQIIATLWGNRPKDGATQSLCSKLCKTLQQELHEHGIEDLLVTSRSSRRINLDILDCDLYDLLDGKEEARKQYYGEYMTDYDWAVYRNYALSKYI